MEETEQHILVGQAVVVVPVERMNRGVLWVVKVEMRRVLPVVSLVVELEIPEEQKLVLELVAQMERPEPVVLLF